LASTLGIGTSELIFRVTVSLVANMKTFLIFKFELWSDIQNFTSNLIDNAVCICYEVNCANDVKDICPHLI